MSVGKVGDEKNECVNGEEEGEEGKLCKKGGE